MIWDRERYIAHCLFEDTGREMFCELFGPLHVLEQEWRAAGVPEDEINMTAFGWDYVRRCDLAAGTGPITGIAPVILSDTPEKTHAIDGRGRHTELIKSTATIPLPLDFPVETPDTIESNSMSSILRVMPSFSAMSAAISASIPTIFPPS